jgi:peroxiredoxin
MTRKGPNNRLLVVLLLLIALVGVAMWYADRIVQQDTPKEAMDATSAVKEGDKAPDFTVEMLDGSSLQLSSLRGKVVLLNFWATYCPPCREELSHVQEQLIDRFAGQSFVFLPISRGEERDIVAQFCAHRGYTFAVGLDVDQQIYHRYASNYIPRNFLIDREGRIVKATIGYDEQEFAELVAYIAHTLDKN